MPELPEVETTRVGLLPHLAGRRITEVRLHRSDLRWPIPDAIREQLPGQRITDVRRRAKYLLMDVDSGSAIWHLGMSGSLRVLDRVTPLRVHDHVELLLDSQQVLRFNDPRRFGCLLWQDSGSSHALLAGLGPEPLAEDFSGDYLHDRSQGRSAPVKNFLMDQSVVVGVGNIYAAESLFHAGIDPRRAAGRVSRERYRVLATAVREILGRAITRGGTTLRDFISPDGAPGYFEQELFVYGRAGLPCLRCGSVLHDAHLGGRTSVWCPHCQR